MRDANTGCRCGSQLAFEQCCQPRIDDSAPAETAEQLMRSRYSAFCRGNVDYLIATHHPSKHRPDDRQQLTDSIDHSRWLGLTIVRCQQGQSEDQQGQVEFIALYSDSEHLHQLHERSRFVKENGRWYYLDGELFDSAPKLPGRNEACWCGSGKKFKKCHG